MLIAALILLVAARFVFPEADPSLFKDTANIHDEFWWAENARQKILFDRWMGDDFAGALAVAPISVAFFYCLFKLFGISFISMRLVALIPAVISVFVVFRLDERKDKHKFLAPLLLASSPLFFDWSRIGQLESLIGLVFLAALITGKKESIISAVISGIIAAIGMQVKGSFLYLLIPLGIWACQKNQSLSWRKGLAFLLGFLVISGGFYIFYYHPHAALFDPYYRVFSSLYYSWQQLLSPSGWVLRVMFLTEKPFLNDPLTALSVIILLFRWILGYVPVKSFSYSLLLLIYSAMILCSDFSEQKFIPLLFLIPLAFTEETKLKKHSPGSVFFATLLLLTPVIPFLNTAVQTSLEDSLRWDSPLLLGFTGVSGLIVTAWYFLKRANRHESWGKSILVISGLIWTTLLLHRLINRHALNAGTGFVLFYVVACGLVVLMIWNSKRNFKLVQLTATLIVSGGLMMVFQLFTARHQVRDAAMFLEIYGKQGEYATGPPSAFALTFLSKVTPLYYFDETIRTDKLLTQDSVIWYCAITDATAGKDQINSQIKKLQDSTGKDFKRKIHFPVYNFRETAVIIRH